MKRLKKIFIYIAVLAFIFLNFYAPARAKVKNWYYDENDHQMLRTLHNELSHLTGSLIFMGPNLVDMPFDVFSLALEKTGKKEFEIVGASFNGLDVLSKIKTKRWEKDGKNHIDISYAPGYELREGVHYFMVKYRQHTGSVAASVVLIVQEKEGENERRLTNRVTVNPKIPKIFGILYKTQQRLKSFSARLTGHFEDYGSASADIMMDFVGKITAIGWDKFSVVSASSPTYTIRHGGKTQINHDEKWKEHFPRQQVIDRNHLGAFNLVYYLDYFVIMDNYNWDISYEDSKEIVLRGYANDLLQNPYQYLIKVDKKRWLPLMVQTYLDKKAALSFAEVEYKTISKIDVPIKQVTTSIFKDKGLQEYTLDISQEIEVNKISPEKGRTI